jgi:hypothetical protein
VDVSRFKVPSAAARFSELTVTARSTCDEHRYTMASIEAATSQISSNSPNKHQLEAHEEHTRRFLSTLWAISATVRYLPPYQSDIEAHDRAPVNSLSTNNVLQTHTHRLIMCKSSGQFSSHVFFAGANILVAIRRAGARPTQRKQNPLEGPESLSLRKACLLCGRCIILTCQESSRHHR